MKLQQKFFTAILLLCSAFSFAQTDSLDFKDGLFLPGKKYTMEGITTLMITKVYSNNAQTDSTKKETVLQMVITSGKISQKDSLFPISMKYLRFDELPFLQNAEIKGYCKPLKMPVFTEISIPSIKLNQEQSNDLINKMNDPHEMLNLLNNMQILPSKKIKIGDTISVVHPTNFPAGRYSKVVTDYVLREIKDGKAYFNVTRTQTTENLPNNITGEGTGSGKAVYDIANHAFLSVNIDGEAIYTYTDGMIKMHVTVSQTTVVEDDP